MRTPCFISIRDVSTPLDARPVANYLVRHRSLVVAAALAMAFGLLTSRSLRAQAVEAPAAEQAEPADGATQPAGEIKNVAIVAVSSYNQVISDVGFIGSLADRPELGQMI